MFTQLDVVVVNFTKLVSRAPVLRIAQNTRLVVFLLSHFRKFPTFTYSI